MTEQKLPAPRLERKKENRKEGKERHIVGGLAAFIPAKMARSLRRIPVRPGPVGMLSLSAETGKKGCLLAFTHVWCLPGCTS